MKGTAVHIENVKQNSSVIIRLDIFLWLSGCEIFSGPLRSGQTKPLLSAIHAWLISCDIRHLPYLQVWRFVWHYHDLNFRNAIRSDSVFVKWLYCLTIASWFIASGLSSIFRRFSRPFPRVASRGYLAVLLYYQNAWWFAGEHSPTGMTDTLPRNSQSYLSLLIWFCRREPKELFKLCGWNDVPHTRFRRPALLGSPLPKQQETTNVSIKYHSKIYFTY